MHTHAHQTGAIFNKPSRHGNTYGSLTTRKHFTSTERLTSWASEEQTWTTTNKLWDELAVAALGSSIRWYDFTKWKHHGFLKPEMLHSDWTLCLNIHRTDTRGREKKQILQVTNRQRWAFLQSKTDYCDSVRCVLSDLSYFLSRRHCQNQKPFIAHWGTRLGALVQYKYKK